MTVTSAALGLHHSGARARVAMTTVRKARNGFASGALGWNVGVKSHVLS